MVIQIQISNFDNCLNFSVCGTYAYLFKNINIGAVYVESEYISGTDRIDSAALRFPVNAEITCFEAANLIRESCKKQGKKVKFIN